MVNSVSANTLNTTFAPFLTTKKAQIADNNVLSAVQVKDYFDYKKEKQEASKEPKKSKAGVIFAASGTTVFALGLVSMALLKPGWIKKNAKTVLNFVNEKIDTLTPNLSNKNKNFLERVSLKFYKMLEVGLEKLEITGNLGTVKDTLINKALRNKTFNDKFWNLGNRFADTTAKIWKGMTLSATESNIRHTRRSWNEVCSTIDTISRVLEQQGKTQSAEKLRAYSSKIAKSVNEYCDGFNTVKGVGGKTRLDNMNEILDGIDKVIEKDILVKDADKLLKTSKTYLTEYRAKSLFEPEKQKIENAAKAHWRKISYDLDDKKKDVLEELSSVRTILTENFDAKDCDACISSLRELRFVFNQIIDHKRKLPNDIGLDILKNNFKKNVVSLQEQVKKLEQAKGGNTAAVEKLDDVIDIIESGTKGFIDEAKDIVKSSETGLGEGHKLFQDLREKIIIARKNHLSTIKSEADQLFDNIRDINVGSAAGDVVGMAIPTAIAGYMVLKQDTTDKKVTEALTMGIPALGGVATAIAMIAKQKSGFNAFALSSIIGLGLNKVGVEVDEIVKKVREKNKTKSK